MGQIFIGGSHKGYNMIWGYASTKRLRAADLSDKIIDDHKFFGVFFELVVWFIYVLLT